VIPNFDKINDAQKLPLLKAFAEMSPYALADEARVLLPSIYSLIQSHVPTEDKPDVKIHFTHVECLLFIFHHLASKIPGNLRTICGIKIVTGQPSDNIGSEEEIKEKYKEFITRLKYLDGKTKGYVDQINQAIKALGKDENEKRQNIQVALKTTENIRELVQTLQQTRAVFLTGQKIRLSWQKDGGGKRKTTEAKTPKTTEAKTPKAAPIAEKPKPATAPNPTKKARPGYQQIYVPPARKEGATTTTTTTTTPVTTGTSRGGRGGFRRGRGRW